jgi:hypothetical protein
MAPCFFSCEGKGTSRRRPPVTGSREESLALDKGVTEVADFLEDEDIEAAEAGAARRIEKGTVVVAVHMVNRSWRELCGFVRTSESSRSHSS